MSFRRSILFLAGLVAVALASTACESVTAYAAKVDGDSVSQNDLESEMRSIARNAQYLQLVQQQQQVRGAGQETFDASFTALTLTRQIYFKLIDRELERRKLKVTQADLDAARPGVIRRVSGDEIFRDFSKEYQDTLVRRSAELNVLTLSLVNQKSLEGAARAYYDTHADEFAEARVAQIVTNTKEEADAARARIASGQDFAAVAGELSVDDSSKARGGELNDPITRETGFAVDFINAVFSVAVGDVSQPVQDQFGFHLIKVLSREVPPYEKVVDRARQRVLAEGEDEFTTWLQQTVKKSKITVNPRYGTFDANSDPPGVVPPPSPTAASTTIPEGANLVPNQP